MAKAVLGSKRSVFFPEVFLGDTSVAGNGILGNMWGMLLPEAALLRRFILQCFFFG